MKIYYLDNLKIFLIALVVAHHVGQSYEIGAASWLIPDPEKASWISILISSNTTFFMGLFFFISAYFLPGSYEKTNPLTLIKKKCIRLGIPTLFVVLFVLPPSFYYLGSLCGGQEQNPVNFTFGHTWFIVQLLLYSTLYIVLRKTLGSLIKTSKQTVLNHKMICLYTFALFGATLLVSIKYPINSWVLFHTFEPFHLPQYISLFCLGILAYEHKWLESLDSRLGYTWLSIGILCVAYLAVHKITGALYFSPLFYLIWSSLMCSAWCVGLLTFFRDFIHANGSLHRYLTNNAYGVYLLHVVFVWFAQCLLLPYSLGGTYKFFIAFIVSYLVSYVFVGLLRKISLVRQII